MLRKMVMWPRGRRTMIQKFCCGHPFLILAIFVLYFRASSLGLVVYACNSSTLEDGTAELRAGGYPGLHSKILAQKNLKQLK
jgi:hypothetical protein